MKSDPDRNGPSTPICQMKKEGAVYKPSALLEFSSFMGGPPAAPLETPLCAHSSQGYVYPLLLKMR